MEDRFLEDDQQRNPWSKTEILNLIDLYKAHEQYFHSSTIKNDKVWNMIASKLKNHTAEQCKNKFKYLKSKYIQKKDSMGNRCTDGKPMNFEYFEQLDNILKNDENVTPTCIASSTRGAQNVIDTSLNEEASEKCNMKKRKRSVLEKQLLEFNEEMKNREAARAARHAGLLQRQDRPLELFEKVANSFSKLTDK